MFKRGHERPGPLPRRGIFSRVLVGAGPVESARSRVQHGAVEDAFEDGVPAPDLSVTTNVPEKVAETLRSAALEPPDGVRPTGATAGRGQGYILRGRCSRSAASAPRPGCLVPSKCLYVAHPWLSRLVGVTSPCLCSRPQPCAGPGLPAHPGAGARGGPAPHRRVRHPTGPAPAAARHAGRPVFRGGGRAGPAARGGPRGRLGLDGRRSRRQDRLGGARSPSGLTRPTRYGRGRTRPLW